MDNFEQFIATYPSEVFEKGQTLLLKGAVPKAIYIIESGFVKTYTITPTGSERLISIDSKGEDLPIGYAFGLIDRAQYFHEAYTKCTIRFVPRDAYVRYLHTNMESMHKRHVRLVILLLSTLLRVSALEQSRASDKVASTLLYMADQIGVRIRPYKTRLKLSITQQELADSLGLTRETAGVELKKLELKKIISYSRKSYILYMERLRKYLEGDDK
jgi:CRP/FNR family transcriptional regulator